MYKTSSLSGTALGSAQLVQKASAGGAGTTVISTTAGTVQLSQAKTLQLLQQQQQRQALLKQQQRRAAAAAALQTGAIAQNKTVAVTTPLLTAPFAAAAGTTQLRMSKEHLSQAMTVAQAGGAQKRLDMQLLLNRQSQAKLLQGASVQQAGASSQAQVRQVQVSQGTLAAASRVSVAVGSAQRRTCTSQGARVSPMLVSCTSIRRVVLPGCK